MSVNPVPNLLKGLNDQVTKLNQQTELFERTELTHVCEQVRTLAQSHLQTAGSALTGYKTVDGKAGQGQLEALQGAVDLMTGAALLQGAKERGYPNSMTEEHPLSWKLRQTMTEGWLFDPLDGTWEHKHNIAGYGILGGFLKRGESGRLNPTHGIIAVPAPDGNDELFFNTVTYRDNGDGTIGATYTPHYMRGGVTQDLPHIRSLQEIQGSGVLRVHMRGLFAEMFDRPEKDHGVKHDVKHVAVAREYAQRLAESLGVKYVEVTAGGSGSGAAQLLSGKVDLVITLGRNQANDRGDAASEWDVVGTVPNTVARGGWVAQATGVDMSVRGFMQRDPRLEFGWIASIALPREIVFNLKLEPQCLSGAERKEIDDSTRIRVEEVLTDNEQEHLIPALTPKLAARVQRVPWAELRAPEAPTRFDISTAAAPLNLIEADTAPQWSEYVEAGRELYAAGKVGVVIVAGGKGTRLGFDKPKGLYPFAGETIFDWHIKQAEAVGRQYGKAVPVAIMTSPATHAETEAFFKQQNHFGRDASNHLFFSQGTIPSLNLEGKAVLESRGELLENPDGHGGFLQAVNRPEVSAFFADKGIAYVMYVQVDNVGAQMDMPGFLGYLAKHNLDVVTGVVKPDYTKEKVGRLMSVAVPETAGERRNIVIEYSELSDEHLKVLGSAGECGNISYYAWRLGADGIGRFANVALPLHRQEKNVVGWRDGAHVPVKVHSAERHIHDLFAVPGVASGAVMLPDRASLFTPIKDNATLKPGAIDTPERAFELVCIRSKKWLEKAGYPVETDRRYLIRPEIAPTEGALLARLQQGGGLMEEDRGGVAYLRWA